MTSNCNKSIYPYCAFPFWYGMHSRDTIVLIDYCDLMSCTTPACFSTFKKEMHSRDTTVLTLKSERMCVNWF